MGFTALHFVVNTCTPCPWIAVTKVVINNAIFTAKNSVCQGHRTTCLEIKEEKVIDLKSPTEVTVVKNFLVPQLYYCFHSSSRHLFLPLLSIFVSSRRFIAPFSPPKPNLRAKIFLDNEGGVTHPLLRPSPLFLCVILRTSLSYSFR